MRPSAPSTVVSVLAVLALSLAGCGDPEQVIETDGVASSDAAASADGVDGADPGAKSAGDEGSTDAPGTDEGPPIPVGDARWARPLGAVAVRMCVDDSANETYEDGQILWTGSWSWSQDTNLIDFSTSWRPEEGPYPPLYDDGPYTAGGHESADAVAGDSVFCAEIWVMPDAADDLLFEYGVRIRLGESQLCHRSAPRCSGADPRSAAACRRQDAVAHGLGADQSSVFFRQRGAGDLGGVRA